MVRWQQEKIARIMGAGGSTASKQSSKVQSAVSSIEKKRKMQILPQYACQQANRAAGARGISGADYFGVSQSGEAEENGAALEMEEH